MATPETQAYCADASGIIHLIVSHSPLRRSYGAACGAEVPARSPVMTTLPPMLCRACRRAEAAAIA